MGRGGWSCTRTKETSPLWDNPPPWVPLWSPPKVGRKLSSLNPLGAKVPKQNFRCWPQTPEGRGGEEGGQGGGVAPLLLLCTAVLIHGCPLDMHVHRSTPILHFTARAFQSQMHFLLDLWAKEEACGRRLPSRPIWCCRVLSGSPVGTIFRPVPEWGKIVLYGQKFPISEPGRGRDPAIHNSHNFPLIRNWYILGPFPNGVFLFPTVKLPPQFPNWGFRSSEDINPQSANQGGGFSQRTISPHWRTGLKFSSPFPKWGTCPRHLGHRTLFFKTALFERRLHDLGLQ